MLTLPLLWVVTFAEYYSSTKDKYHKFYVSLSCIFTTSQFTDKNE